MTKTKTIRRVFGACLATVLIAGLVLGAGATKALGEPEITRVTASSNFPGSITFVLEAQATSTITDIRLHYRVERDCYARVVSEAKPVFAPASQVNVSWVWDMRQSGGLPPGAEVEYWWTVRDINGRVASSAPEFFIFTDTRFTWQQIVRDNLTMNWYGNNGAKVQTLLTASLAGLSELSEKTGAHLVRPVQVYVYANTRAMQEAMMFPQEWTGAVTYTDQSTILIGLADDWDWNEKTMVHELAHMVSYQMTRGPYSSVPVWLSEGFSMYAEGPPNLYIISSLVSALNDGYTITVRSLSGPFSADSGRSYLSYAQSYSFVDYLVANYGQEQMLALLTVFARGADYDGALLEVYGFDMDGLYENWLEYALNKYVLGVTV